MSSIMLPYSHGSMCIHLYQGWDLDWALRKGVTRDTGIESQLGPRTGRGNRRPEVICDVNSRRRKSPSVGDTLGIPTECASLLTDA